MVLIILGLCPRYVWIISIFWEFFTDLDLNSMMIFYNYQFQGYQINNLILFHLISIPYIRIIAITSEIELIPMSLISAILIVPAIYL